MCGLNSDNIYTYWGNSNSKVAWAFGDPKPPKKDRETGIAPQIYDDFPLTDADSMLVSEQKRKAQAHQAYQLFIVSLTGYCECI